ncbi:MAG: PDZ domain-containing protein [Candidatus Omnitrophota bacterium]
MTKENIIILCGIGFLVVLLITAFTSNPVQDAALGAFHEIKTADMFGDKDPVEQAQQHVAFTPGCPIPAGAGAYQPVATLQAGAMAAAVTGTTVIAQGQNAPELVKIMGVEAIEVAGGKVKITGVMGSSWADKAGLVAGDILLSFNDKSIEGFEQFKTDLAALPPEKDYKFTYLRGASKKKGIIFVGEGEMEGFLPIPTPK